MIPSHLLRKVMASVFPKTLVGAEACRTLLTLVSERGCVVKPAKGAVANCVQIERRYDLSCLTADSRAGSFVAIGYGCVCVFSQAG